MKRVTVQLVVAVLLTLGGIVLLFSGFWVDPDGVIDSSVWWLSERSAHLRGRSSEWIIRISSG